MLEAEGAAALYRTLADGGVRCWVMGGWGVDALLGRQTRPHKDLDVLVAVDDLVRLHELLAEQGFVRKYVWDDENRWLELGPERLPSAFVAGNSDDVELDVHVIEVVPGGAPVPLCDVPWPFAPDSLDGRGMIASVEVACVSAGTQIAMHAGYELPATHASDVELLRSL
jgi:lincosamide nucleotidyltransferase A/C/D/E